MSPEADDSLPEALYDRLGFLLGQAHLAHRVIAESRLASLGIGVKAFGALSVLADEGPLSQQRLGRRMQVDRTTMVAVSKELEQAGLVTRNRNPSDRRAYTLEVTARGRRVLARALEAADQAEDDFLRGLSAQEQRQLRSLLRRLITP